MQLNWQLSQLSFLHNTELTLSRLQLYLVRVQAQLASSSTYNHFTSDCGHHISQCSSSLPDLSLLLGEKSQVHLYLTDLKLWVHHSLNNWLHANLECEDACTVLAKIIDTYAMTACSAYIDMLEDVSLMLLTTINLWVALDKCVLHHYPLLHDYNPGFPPSLFEPLLLPRKAQMQQLFHIEQHLAIRRKAALLEFLFIFWSDDALKSFTVHYFEWSSHHHQELQKKIKMEVTTEQSQKLSELTKKHHQYHELIKQSDRMNCQYVSH